MHNTIHNVYTFFFFWTLIQSNVLKYYLFVFKIINILTLEPVKVVEVASHKGNYEAYYNLIITLDSRFDRYVVVTKTAVAG